MPSILAVLSVLLATQVPNEQARLGLEARQVAKPPRKSEERRKATTNAVAMGSDKDREQNGKRTAVVQTDAPPWTRSEIVNLWIAVATTLYFMATLGILGAMIGANRKTDSALAKTQRSNELIEENIQLAHRPSLHLVALQMVSGIAEDYLDTRAILKNAGTDAAHDVRCMMMLTTEALDELVLDRKLAGLLPIDHHGMIGSGLEVPVSAAGSIAKDERAGIDGISPFHLLFGATFRDSFGNRYRFESVWRWERHPEPQFVKGFERQPPPIKEVEIETRS